MADETAAAVAAAAPAGVVVVGGASTNNDDDDDDDDDNNNDNNYYPVWLDDHHVDPNWIRDKLVVASDDEEEEDDGLGGRHRRQYHFRNCVNAKARDVSNANRKSRDGAAKNGTTLKLTLTMRDTTALLHLVVKQVPKGDSATTTTTATQQSLALSRRLGLAREALFYKTFAHELSSLSSPSTKGDSSSSSSSPPHPLVPKVYYSYGNFDEGDKVVVMEDLSESGVDSSVFFGPGNPHNWNRDLAAQASRAGGSVPTPELVTETTFRSIAKVHGKFWKRADLLLTPDKAWLRGQEWIQGRNRESWEASQDLIRSAWDGLRKNGGDTAIKWDRQLRSIVDKAVAGISWEAQLRRLDAADNGCHWTLVHGDFWPGNCMWMIQDRTIRLLDWEMVGIGSGPQDLGQYVLSNMDPTVRRAHERRLVEAYYEELRNALPEDVTVSWEYVWNEYRVGGVERWLWFLVWFLGQGPNFVPWAQFFHDQISSFVRDHGLRPEDITQPRP